MRAPSFSASVGFDRASDPRLSDAPELAELRAQAAVVRTLADELERSGQAGETQGLSEQLLEEMDRLGDIEARATLNPTE